MNPQAKQEALEDERAVQTYISQKMAPFDDYQFRDVDRAVEISYILEKFSPTRTDVADKTVDGDLVVATYVREKMSK